MSLCGEIVSETIHSIRFRVLTTVGDAPAFGIQGEHELKKNDCVAILRKDPHATPERLWDQVELNPQKLDELAKRSFPLDS